MEPAKKIDNQKQNIQLEKEFYKTELTHENK